jgi:hypothetical protein
MNDSDRTFIGRRIGYSDSIAEALALPGSTAAATSTCKGRPAAANQPCF